jgi:hypothetical protein
MGPKGLTKRVRHALDAFESAPDAMARLAAARELSEAVEELEIAAVVEVREAGGTWGRIGEVYGTTKQAAQQRFRSAATNRVSH